MSHRKSQIHRSDRDVFTTDAAGTSACLQCFEDGRSLTIVVFGASGDLAKKKTFPALFALYASKRLPREFRVVGYARSALKHEQFIAKISAKFAKVADKNLVDGFLDRCSYVQGAYDQKKGFKNLQKVLAKAEGKAGAHRIYYLALPPALFVPVAGCASQNLTTHKACWTRLIVEKPFGRSLSTCLRLNKDLLQHWAEKQLYRIDHYLAKEMVQSIAVLRWANTTFEPLWNSNHISSVLISWKETAGLSGRAGYFDSYGIIRDVAQNHLCQLLSLVAMEAPVTLAADDVRDEKVRVLRYAREISVRDTVTGQFAGYKDDEAVPDDSRTPTFACMVIYIDSPRWQGVPFIIKCGKAMDASKCEVRVQFRESPHSRLFGDKQLSSNELVIRVQPSETIYLKTTTKAAGLFQGFVHTDMQLLTDAPAAPAPAAAGDDVKEAAENAMAQATAFGDAYERLVYDTIRGDQSLFVRSDELEQAWRIFDPLLSRLESDDSPDPVPLPIEYDQGSRGPAAADELLARVGFRRTPLYRWRRARLDTMIKQ